MSRPRISEKAVYQEKSLTEPQLSRIEGVSSYRLCQRRSSRLNQATATRPDDHQHSRGGHQSDGASEQRVKPPAGDYLRTTSHSRPYSPAARGRGRDIAGAHPEESTPYTRSAELAALRLWAPSQYRTDHVVRDIRKAGDVVALHDVSRELQEIGTHDGQEVGWSITTITNRSSGELMTIGSYALRAL
jgi:hypothetical protein